MCPASRRDLGVVLFRDLESDATGDDRSKGGGRMDLVTYRVSCPSPILRLRRRMGDPRTRRSRSRSGFVSANAVEYVWPVLSTSLRYTSVRRNYSVSLLIIVGLVEVS